jgi:nitroimidazol reductase NimA-like FMN-containing flavoprotein (pyridoxamine 5'-phosphate oxidase superfamily)
MRRHRQQLEPAECQAILARHTSGVLALHGDDGYAYAVPVSHLYVPGENRLIFHSASTGHKVESIRRDPKVSFCVIDQDDVQPETYTTWFRSVIAFGQARVIEDPAEARRAIELFGEHYSPGDPDGLSHYIDQQRRQLTVIELAIEHLTGKESRALTRQRAAQAQAE